MDQCDSGPWFGEIPHALDRMMGPLMNDLSGAQDEGLIRTIGTRALGLSIVNMVLHFLKNGRRPFVN